MSPTVSIVTATYNRNNVLRLTIESVLASKYTDWELIVVGDACTDDTESVVMGFRDERIRFVNLPHNHGEQSVPNNEGVRLARGRYVAFLNHDDLWAENHLEIAVAELEKGRPFVHTVALSVPPDGPPVLAGATLNEQYDPSAFVPASLWVMKREVLETVGPWRAAQTIYMAPSADWLFRAWKFGIPIHSIRQVTAICIMSGGRARSYADRHSVENETWAAALRDDPRLIEKHLPGVAIRASANDLAVGRHVTRGLKNLVMRVCYPLGLHPTALWMIAIHRRRGAFLNHLRRVRGLPPLPKYGVRQ